jgi:DNA-binding response OmpR family regulator
MVKVLVAVAEPRILSYVAEGLRGQGLAVHAAGSIEGVIDALAEERFDIVVSDIFQPVLEGVALFSTIARASPRTRVIALMDFQSARARNYDLGLYIDSVIVKPFTLDRVRNEIEWVIHTAPRRIAAPVPA